jgi:hypothetical protein
MPRLLERAVSFVTPNDGVNRAGGIVSKHSSLANESQPGKRGGLRIIYYWWDTGSQFWLFTVYDKDELADLTALQRNALKEMIKKELEARRKR